MYTDFAKGIMIGMVAGAAVGAVAAMPKKGSTAAGRFLKTAGHIVENISDALGM